MMSHKKANISIKPPNPPTSKRAVPRLKLSTPILLLLIWGLLTQCGLDIEDPTPPSPPKWIQKSLPEEWPERGIDAHESEGIYLEWEPNSEENIAAYLIYRAEYFEGNDSLGDYDLLARFQLESIPGLEFIDTSGKTRKRYYYKLKAEDTANNRSAYSDSISYSLLPQISINWMIPNGILTSLDTDRSLDWHYPYSIEMENYCLSILNQNNDFIFRAIINPGSYVSGWESWLLPDSVTLHPGQIYKWRIDAAAKYENGLESTGSESPWAMFLYVAE
jgi:hypothetical protein